MESFRLSIQRNYLQKQIAIEIEHQKHLLTESTKTYSKILPISTYSETKYFENRMLAYSIERIDSKKRQIRLEKKLTNLK